MEGVEESKWLEQDEQENVGQEKVRALHLYSERNLEFSQKNEVEDTEELEVFRRQWQEELRHVSSDSSQQRQQEKKETEVCIFNTAYISSPLIRHTVCCDQSTCMPHYTIHIYAGSRFVLDGSGSRKKWRYTFRFGAHLYILLTY